MLFFIHICSNLLIHISLECFKNSICGIYNIHKQTWKIFKSSHSKLKITKKSSRKYIFLNTILNRLKILRKLLLFHFSAEACKSSIFTQNYPFFKNNNKTLFPATKPIPCKCSHLALKFSNYPQEFCLSTSLQQNEKLFTS